MGFFVSLARPNLDFGLSCDLGHIGPLSEGDAAQLANDLDSPNGVFKLGIAHVPSNARNHEALRRKQVIN